MTEFERMVTETLHRRLDAVAASAEMPSTVSRRAKRGRMLTASVGVLVLASLLGGSAWVGAMAFDRGFDAAGHGDCPYEPEFEMTIYLRDDVTKQEIQELGALLSGSEEVGTVTFVSKKKAFAEFVERYKDEPQFYENLPEDALPAHFDVDLEEGVDAGAFSEAVGGEPGIEDVRYAGGFVERLCGDYEP